jgi:hypothetical protein
MAVDGLFAALAGRGLARHGRIARVAASFGLLRYVWHPALFVFAVYMIVLSYITLVVAR